MLPDGTLFGEGVKAKVKRLLLEECNLHTIVRLPNGVFRFAEGCPLVNRPEPRSGGSVGKRDADNSPLEHRPPHKPGGSQGGACRIWETDCRYAVATIDQPIRERLWFTAEQIEEQERIAQPITDELSRKERKSELSDLAKALKIDSGEGRCCGGHPLDGVSKDGDKDPVVAAERDHSRGAG